MKARLAWELEVNGTELAIRMRQILVPNPEVPMIVPFPQLGPEFGVIFMQPLVVPVDQRAIAGCCEATRSE